MKPQQPVPCSYASMVLVLVVCSLCAGQQTHQHSHSGHSRGHDAATAGPRFAIQMTPPEVQLLKEYLHNSTFYFEYGCGGSTVLAADIGVKKVVSVDSHPQWVQKVQSAVSARGAAVTVNYVDIGEVGSWGFPKDNTSRQMWPKYAEFIHGVDGTPDLVLVDGRFRISCCLNALLKAGPNTTILMHDFWPRTRSHGYRAVLPVADVVDGVDALAVFRRRRDATDAAIHALIDAYRFHAQ